MTTRTSIRMTKNTRGQIEELQAAGYGDTLAAVMTLAVDRLYQSEITFERSRYDPEDWAEWLFQCSYIESVESYAEKIRGMTHDQVAQHLVHQHTDTPDTEKLIAWAKDRR